MTKRRKEVLDYITQFIVSRGYSPSFAEIGAAFGFKSPATVHKHVHNLERNGYLKMEHNRHGIVVKGRCPSCSRGDAL